MSTLVWLIPLFPLLGSVVNALSGRHVGHRAHWIAVPAVAPSFLASCAGVRARLERRDVDAASSSLDRRRRLQGGGRAQVDQLSAVMMLVVTGVGFLIHVYSIGYMDGDHGYARFFTYLNLFMFSMLMLVLADNFLLLYVVWEAVGLCSYLLIGFWYSSSRRPTRARRRSSSTGSATSASSSASC